MAASPSDAVSSARAVGNSLAGLGPSRAAASCAMRVPSAAQPYPCRRTGLATRDDRPEQHHRPSRPRGGRGGPARRKSQRDARAPLPPSRGASPPSSPHPATRLAAPSPSRVSPRSGTAKGSHKQHHRYQRHHAGAGQNRRHRVGTLDGAPGLGEGGLGGAGWLGCPPPAVRQASGVGETISGRRGGGSDARSGCWPEDVAGSAILGAPGASSRAERRQLVAGAAGWSGRHRMLVGVGCLGV
mmetsp:Transcript_21115/g.62487  ORF Transcript_21115/g.62487 Transcript_21115/m.62487 type:complete len:242 (-) Transcript_21115:1484-2209(-)